MSRRLVAGLGLIGALLALAATQASAAYRHTTVTAEFGEDGTAATTFGSAYAIDYHQANHRLYVFGTGPQRIFGLDVPAPGTFNPLGGAFPLSPGTGNSFSQLAVDNSAEATANNIYFAPDTQSVYGFGPSGSGLGGWPISTGGETCGVAVDNAGDVWVGNYGKTAAEKYSPGGTLISSVDLSATGRPCKIEIDRSNNDLYVSAYGGDVDRYTAASGYTSSTEFDDTTDNPLAVNAANNRLYVSRTSKINAYDTISGELIEEITAGSNFRDLAVNEATDTLYVVGTNNRVKELPAALVPTVVTGDPIGNSSVSGVVDPDGGGEITECFFEFGQTTSYGSTEPCSPAPPYTGEQAVTANLPGLEGETTYNYRLVASNASAGGTNFGANKTIIPHNVQALATEDATEVDRASAKLHASFEGNGEETKYYFEWGTSTAYGSQSAAPPGESAGSPTGPTSLSFDASGLQPGTFYHYRVVAENGLGVSKAADKTFTTLPAVQSLTTDPASEVARRSATLNASYVGDGDETTYTFEWGKTTSYGNSTPIESAGTPSGPTPLSAELTELELETTYHFRIVATNSLGTTKGADQSFATLPAVAGVVTTAATDISQEGVTLNGEFTGNGEETHYYFEYGLTTSYGMISETPPGTDAGEPIGSAAVSSEVTDFEAYETYHYRIVASNSVGATYGNDETFTALPAPLPDISGTTASSVTPTNAMLEARINPNRWLTIYSFEFGPTHSYGSSTEINGPIGSDHVPHPVSNLITGLTPGTTYHFRVVAINFTGTTYGPDQAFKTPDAPRIDLTSAFATSQSSAHLTAFVSPNSSATAVRFEYGSSPAYGATTASTPIGASGESREVGADVTGLAPGTTYHFRVVASNAFGTTLGPNRTFTTSPAVPPAKSSTRNCGNLGRRAKRNSNRAKQLRRKAAKSSSRKRSRTLRKRAARLAKKARQLSSEAKVCRRSGRSA